MSKKKNNEDIEFNELMNYNNVNDLIKIKDIINNIIHKDIKVLAKNDKQKDLIKSIKNKEITICSGLAGSGKTFVALAYALNLLKKKGNSFKKIYLVKSVTPLKNEEIGFLKGDLNEKITPFMWSYYINLEKIIDSKSLDSLLSSEIIKPFPLAYMRGASLDDCIIICDESQNISLDNSRTLMTRIGTNCKLIILGDLNQVDLKNKKDSSLKTLISLFNDVNDIGVVEMNEEDVNIRNPLITTIENKFSQLSDNVKNNKKNLVELNGYER